VILVDANLLLYAVLSEFPQHLQAREWLDGQLNGHARVGLPWLSLLAFLRVATSPRLFSSPMAMSDAWQRVDRWLALGNVWSPPPSERHAAIFGRFCRSSANSPRLVSDAHLAALAIEHGLTLCSTDGDFARFTGLRWENPLERR